MHHSPLPADFSPFARLHFPCLMGVVNITPDSFSDGGQFLYPRAAAGHARKLVEAGAQILDLGAEASSFFRAGVEPVSPEEQLRRLLPVLEHLRALPADVLISVDTRSAEVARAVIEAGADLINDISGGRHDAELLNTVAQGHAGIILMHMNPNYPRTPGEDDPGIVHTVREALAGYHACALAAGIPAERIALDPGIGFGHTMADNWRLCMRAAELRGAHIRAPFVLGASRKRFFETSPPADVKLPADWKPMIESLRPHAGHPRDPASAALTALAASQGVEIHRVHDVKLAAMAIANTS